MNKRKMSLIFSVAFLIFLIGWVVKASAVSSIKASPSFVRPGEKIFVRFSGAPGNDSDWIAIYPVGEKSENYGEWYYLKGEKEGELIFTAPDEEGRYEFRMFANWPEGGYKPIATSNIITVRKSITYTSTVLYNDDVFRLSTGELITGKLLSFDGRIFKVKTGEKVVEKKREEVVCIILGTKSLGKEKIISQWALKARASSEYTSSDWSAMQATGKPDTFKCGDFKTAWAPKPGGSEPEWLELTFNTPVYATGLRVHETYNAGFIYKVEFVDISGRRYLIWQGKDTTNCPGWFEVETEPTPYLVKKVIIHTRKEGWEEIDAVELKGFTAL